MSQTPPSIIDPFDLLRGIGSRLEQALAHHAHHGVRSDVFAKGMHQSLGAALTARKLGRQWQTLVLHALNMPTRADVLTLTEKLQALEDRVIALAASVERLGKPGAGMPAVAPSPPRTRGPAASAAMPPSVPLPRSAKASKAKRTKKAQS